MPRTHLDDIYRLFDVFGGDEEGLVPISDVAVILSEVGDIKPSAFNEILSRVDMNGDGFVNLDELVSLIEHCRPVKRSSSLVVEKIFSNLAATSTHPHKEHKEGTLRIHKDDVITSIRIAAPVIPKSDITSFVGKYCDNEGMLTRSKFILMMNELEKKL